MALDMYLVCLMPIAKWYVVGQSDRLNSRQRANTVQQLLMKRSGMHLVVTGLHWIDAEIEDITRIKTEVHRPGMIEAADEQPGGNQQHQRSRELHNDERTADASHTTSSGRSSRTVLHQLRNVGQPSAPGGNDANDHGCDQDEEQTIQSHSPIKTEVESDGNVELQWYGSYSPAKQGPQQ